LVLPLGDKLAWISMVLVTKARRRGGVGTGLLKRCIAEVQRSGAVAGLDATEQGRPIYLPLGFRDLYRSRAGTSTRRRTCRRLGIRSA
jgi:GNAT superfamily N-acetyltransferase